MSDKTIAKVHNEGSTEKMMNKLKSVEEFDEFYLEHLDDFVSVSLWSYIQELIKQKSLSKIDVIKGADLDRVYGYQIISGKRMPTREKLIQLGFGLKLDVNGMQAILKTVGMAPLYVKVKREAAILFCLAKGYDIFKTQAFLQQTNLRLIGE